MSKHLFASFLPVPHQRRTLEFLIREARLGDVEVLAALTVERNGGGDLGQVAERMRTRLGQDPAMGHMFVAELGGGEVVAFGSAAYFEFDVNVQTAALNQVPSGWYLTGVIVTPSCRRAGIGRALTDARIKRLASLGVPIRFVVNAQNTPSIALHEGLGFTLESEQFTMPDVTFTGGKGLLYCFEPRRGHDASEVSSPELG